MFTYTAEEKEHLSDLSVSIFLMDPCMYDPKYFRYLAEMEREEPTVPYGDAENGPHPSDCDVYPTADDYDEIADAIECGYQQGDDCY